MKTNDKDSWLDKFLVDGKGQWTLIFPERPADILEMIRKMSEVRMENFADCAADWEYEGLENMWVTETTGHMVFYDGQKRKTFKITVEEVT